MYNEENQIGTTLDYVLQYLQSKTITFEIIVMDDGSTDNSFKVAKEWEEKYPNIIHVHRITPNQGKGKAVKEGMLFHSQGEIRCYYDADASTPIEEIDKLIEVIFSGYDIAIASRGLPDSVIEIPQPEYRQFMGKVYNFILRLFGLTHFRDTQCGCKCFTKWAVENVFPKQTLSRFSFDAEILFIAEKQGLKIKEVPTRWRNRKESRVHPIKDSLIMLRDVFKIKINDLSGLYD